MSLKVFSIHKKESVSFENIQDKYAYSKNLSSIALSDGATQSLDSALWSEILVNSYVENPTNNPSEFLQLFINSANDFVAKKEKEKSSEEQNKALVGLLNQLKEKGSYCTFVGVEINGDIAKVASYGDSVLFHFRKGKLINSIPTNNSEKLDSYSNFLNTNIIRDEKCFNENFLKSETLLLEKEDLVILCTDAFSKYLLNNNSLYNELLNITTFKEFSEHIVKSWDDNKLEEDDVSIVMYCHDESNKVFKIEPSNDFEFKEDPIATLTEGEEEKEEKGGVLNKFKLIMIILVLIGAFVSYFILQETDGGNKDNLGCLDPKACNYNPNDTLGNNNGLPVECTYPITIWGNEYVDCDGRCILDTDQDGVCDQLEISGCTDPAMYNYNTKATDDDGSCIEKVRGCMDKSATNYNRKANISTPKSCIKKIMGCTDSNAINYDSLATVNDGSCIWKKKTNLFERNRNKNRGVNQQKGSNKKKETELEELEEPSEIEKDKKAFEDSLNKTNVIIKSDTTRKLY